MNYLQDLNLIMARQYTTRYTTNTSIKGLNLSIIHQLQQLYQELSLESLRSRRWIRKLYLFYEVYTK